MWPDPQFPADLVTFTEEILNAKLHFLCSVEKILLSIFHGYTGRKVQNRLWKLSFCFWGELLVIENSLYSICSVYSDNFSPFYIFICIKHATKIFTISPLMGCPIYQVLFDFIFANLRTLDSNSWGIWCLKFSLELRLLVSLLISSAYFMSISLWPFGVTRR